MTHTKPHSRFLEALQKRVLIFDGAMGTSLQGFNLTEKQFGGKELVGCNDALVLFAPEVVERVHRSFLEVGADVIETDTFRGNRLTLADYHLQDRTIELNLAAANLARKVADEYNTPEQPRFVAGSMGPSGKLISTDDPQMSDITYDELVDVFREQAVGLIQGGVDVLLIETSQDILEVKAVVQGIHLANAELGTEVPIQAQVTLDINGRMLLGTDISAALAILEGLDIDLIGMNCSTGPEHMRQSIAYLSEHTHLPISVIPNAGLPMNVNGEAVYPMKPDQFSDLLADYVGKFGIRVVGGCCGTTPDHICELVKKVKATKPAIPEVIPMPALASPTQAVATMQEPAPFMIGERLNAQGSRIFKKMVLTADFDSMIQVARDQVDNGAHGLDISMAVTERTDEADMMAKIVKRLSLEVPVPLIIDSTEPEVIEAALQKTGGRCLINSTNLEAGEAKSRKLFAVARKYSAAVMALTIDEQGMAKTAERKLEVAKRIHDLAVNEYRLAPSDLVFDDLTFTLATGEAEFRDSAIETLKGIELIKRELPGVRTSLGVSNVSFGLSPVSRKVLNSVFLFHAEQAGLDMAIVNPAQIKPYSEISTDERELAEALIFNRSEDALANLITYFDQHTQETGDEGHKEDPFAGLSVAERLQARILTRQKIGVEEDINQILALDPTRTNGEKAVEILNQVLLPAMKEVGDRFGAGELILPFVLQSAEVMKKSVAYLENYLEKKEGMSKGKLVLATVYGDVHDIGKNLVKTILTNNGYDVVDLGKQVPAETIISAAIAENATAIGLSALLVSTSKQMPLIINELHRRKLNIPVLVGGAAINPRFGWRILRGEDGNYYEPGVFYCKDAFEGLGVMDALTDPQKLSTLKADTWRKAEHEFKISETHQTIQREAPVSALKPAETIPAVQEWGVRVVEELPLPLVAQHLNLNELYRLSWGGKNTHGAAWQTLTQEFDERRVRMVAEAQREGWLKPRAVYGYWPVLAEGDELLVYDPETIATNKPVVLERFAFPRQKGGEGLSLVDYYLPVGSEGYDVVALQVVTVGQEATRRFTELEAQDRYTDAYYLHGLAVQMAEATADYLHDHIRRELGLAIGQGLRYSWGYPAIPELSDHVKVFKLLPAHEALGMELTSAYQLVPEQSTAAIIVHHPDAKYFNVGVNRVEQLLG
ncbi:MAG: methionine synthase [Anaerolineaceae bacterium]